MYVVPYGITQWVEGVCGLSATQAGLLLPMTLVGGLVIVITVIFGVDMGFGGAGNQTALYYQAPAEQPGTAFGPLRTFG